MRGRVAIGIWLMVLLWSGAVLYKTPLSADMSAFLPRSPTAEQQLLVDQLREGVVSRLLLVGLSGLPEDRLARLSDGLVAGLARSPSFTSVNNGSAELMDADVRYLLDHRYQLSPGVTSRQFTEDGLEQALRDGLDQLGSSTALLTNQLLPRDPTGEMMHLVEQLRGEGGPEKAHGVWFAPDRKRALLIAQTRAPGFDLDGQEAALAELRAVFAGLPEAAAAKLVVSGPAVFAVSTRASIKHDAARFSLLATALVATLLLLAYRSATALVLTFVPVASGALAGAACVGVVYGSLHGATLGFGATLIGEAVDYAIYFFSNMESGLPPRRTLDRIWPTLRLGVMTSVCGFCGMLFSGFPGLAQLGLFSISGLIVAALVTRGVLPALTPHDFRLRSSDALPRLLMRLFAGLAVFRQILPLALIGVVAWLLMRSGPFWSDELASLSPVPQAEQRLDEELRSALGAPTVRHLIIARGRSMEDALQAAERTGARLDALIPGGALAAYDSPARHLPSAQAQRARQDALPARADLQRNLAAATRKLAYRNNAFEPFLADAEAARSAKALVRDDLRGTTLALKVDSLLVERRGEWFALMPLRGVRDAGAVTQAAGADAVVLDIKDASDALYRNYRLQVVLYSIVGVVIIIGLLLAATRSVRRMLDVLMPLVAAVLVTCAILVAMGIALSLFHLVALLLVVGVGSNYSLFFERENFARGNPVRTVAALVLCATSTIIGFGLLGFAGTPVLSSIGLTVAIGTFLSLIFAAALTARL